MASDRDRDDGPSRSQRRRESLEMRELAEALAALPAPALEDASLNPALVEAAAHARELAREARRRQIGYVARLLRAGGARAARDVVERARAGGAARTAAHHRVERWRDRLLDEGDPALAALVDEHSGVDTGHLRRLVRAARRERERGAAPRAARELYRCLRDVLEAPAAEPA